MTSITIRKLDPAAKERLRIRAAERGRSMAAEARDILRGALEQPPDPNTRERTGADLVAEIRVLFAPIGYVDLELPSRKSTREPPKFD